MKLDMDLLNSVLPYIIPTIGWFISIEMRLRQFKLDIDRKDALNEKVVQQLDEVRLDIVRLTVKLEEWRKGKE